MVNYIKVRNATCNCNEKLIIFPTTEGLLLCSSRATFAILFQRKDIHHAGSQWIPSKFQANEHHSIPFVKCMSILIFYICFWCKIFLQCVLPNKNFALFCIVVVFKDYENCMHTTLLSGIIVARGIWSRLQWQRNNCTNLLHNVIFNNT